jgi:hypothetical protein
VAAYLRRLDCTLGRACRHRRTNTHGCRAKAVRDDSRRPSRSPRKVHISSPDRLALRFMVNSIFADCRLRQLSTSVCSDPSDTVRSTPRRDAPAATARGQREQAGRSPNPRLGRRVFYASRQCFFPRAGTTQNSGGTKPFSTSATRSGNRRWIPIERE